MFRLRVTSGLSVLLVSAILAGPVAAAAQGPAVPSEESVSGDPVADARKLATTGHRAEALQRLSAYLEFHATDTDARNLYGVVMSWEGRYDEARAQLQAVLERSPNNTDTLQALINLEMWSGREQAAEALARRALTDNGSSGSPVFDANFGLLALHHGGRATRPRLSAPGFHEASEGVLISAIAAKLRRDLAARPRSRRPGALAP